MPPANVQAKIQTKVQVSSAAASPLKRLLQHLRPYRRRVWLAATCSVVNKVFDPPVLIGLAVDVVERHLLALPTGSTVSSQLITLAILSFLVWTAESRLNISKSSGAISPERAAQPGSSV